MPLDPIALVLSQRGILPAQVHIRNLTSTTTAGIDGWGRSKKLQPLQISVSVGLNAPFTTSSDTDSVDSSTVHYGFLAKAILASLEGYSGTTNDSTDDPTTLASMLVRVWSHLTGLSVDGRERNLPEDDRPFLDVTSLRSLTVTLTLPKASLLGSGVSIMATALFGLPSVAPGLVSTFAIQLAVRGIRVPTLVGVNSNERQAKQIVIADVEVDRFDTEGDIYADLEAEIAKVNIYGASPQP